MLLANHLGPGHASLTATLIGTWSATVKRDGSGTTASQDVSVPVASAGVESAFPVTAPRRPALTFDSGGSIAGVARALLTPQQQLTLAERIRNHDPVAEEELVRAFSSRIAFLVFVRTRDREAARDLTQDVLMAVVVALRDGHLREPERLAGFVFGTARNVINGYLRARSRQPREDPIEAGFDLATIPDTLEDTERGALVRRALDAVDSTDRKILFLTLVEGLKPGEIAVRLGLTSEVVRARKSRAIKKVTERVKRLSRI
jgi:RNA polymerase sigma factor (sigma-70 family)